MNNIHKTILAIVTISTVALFFLIASDYKSTLFIFNLSFALFLEVIFIGTVLKVSNKSMYTTPNISIISHLARFVYISVFIMVVYNVAQLVVTDNFLEPKWYYVSLGVVSAFYAVIILITFQAGTSQQTLNEKLKTDIDHRQQLSLELKQAKQQFQYVNLEPSSPLYPIYEKCLKTLNIAQDKIQTIPTANLINKIENTRLLENDMTAILFDINKLKEKPDERDIIIKSIHSKAEIIIDHISLLKS